MRKALAQSCCAVCPADMRHLLCLPSSAPMSRCAGTSAARGLERWSNVRDSFLSSCCTPSFLYLCCNTKSADDARCAPNRRIILTLLDSRQIEHAMHGRHPQCACPDAVARWWTACSCGRASVALDQCCKLQSGEQAPANAPGCGLSNLACPLLGCLVFSSC